MSLANISTILALTVATSYAAGCKMQGGLCNNMFPCCDGFTCTDVGGGVTTCQAASELVSLAQKAASELVSLAQKCAKEGEATYEGMPCCEAGMTSYSCWFDASQTCCYNSTFLQ